MHTYKVTYEVFEKKDGKPFTRTYCFSTQNKRLAMRIATDILVDYILDMGFYSGSVKTIKEIK